MTILTKTTLRQRLSRRDRKRLVVTPLLSDTQLGDSSVDVRLGNEFLLPSRELSGQFSYGGGPENEGIPEDFKHIRREFQSPLYVHPQQFVLGATLEFISLPDDLSCYVIGKSSLGRAGLIIATATAVAPGFKGCITLEMVNIGEIPLPLYPGMRIAQLVIHLTSDKAHYSGRFLSPVGPERPKLDRDPEMKIWQSAPESEAPSVSASRQG